MIRNTTVAEMVSKLMIETIARLNESVSLVESRCPPEELSNYRRAVGALMGEIVIEIMNPLYSMHPALKPPAME